MPETTQLQGIVARREAAVITERPLVSLIDPNNENRLQLAAQAAERGLRFRGYESIDEYLAAGVPDRPACVVIDYDAPGDARAAAPQPLTCCRDRAPVLLLVGHADVPAAIRLLSGCAFTLIEKPTPTESVVAAVERAVAADAARLRVLRRAEPVAMAVAALTGRERSVLEAITRGELNKSIAKTLDVSVRTIEGDRSKIVEKFGAATTGEVVSKYAEHRLLQELGYGRSPGSDAAISASA
ncbi:MAG: LuxR C-terminal-related transcriptional regulator [Planctomycetota bacterium]